jgi:hypothetical protein
MPPYGDVAQVLENAHTKGIDSTYIKVSRSSRMVASYHTLKEEDRGVDPDRLMRIRMVVCADRGSRRDKGGACEAG